MEAVRRQTAHDLASRVIGDLAVLHDAERQIELYEKTLLPRAQNIVSAVQRTYAVGQSSMLDSLDAERSLIALRRMLAELKIVREKQIADLEAVAAMPFMTNSSTNAVVDLETIKDHVSTSPPGRMLRDQANSSAENK
jgi:outer membrane protein TolC